ncbi:hypothetical protein, partial [Klebsiella pneumoniae]
MSSRKELANAIRALSMDAVQTVSYTHLRAHETLLDIV